MKTWGHYIGGEWRLDRETRPIRSPFDDRIVGYATGSEISDAEEASAAATSAFPLTQKLSSSERYAILRTIHDGISSRREEFVESIVHEAAKPIRDARGEVDRALLVFSLAAEEARRLGGDVLPLDLNAASTGRLGITRRFPIGPVAALTPFNFPLNLVAHKVAPAIAAGCPVVLKPAEKTPLTSLLLAEVIGQSGWPVGALSVLTPATPQAVGTLLATDARLPVLSFTGSDSVGWHLKSLANKKRVLLELGGNAAVIVHEDADVEYSAARCAVGAFAYSGQVCISVQRIFVHKPIFDRWMEVFVRRTLALRLGDPADETVDLGPVISAAAADKIEKIVADAIEAGARPVVSGERTRDTALLSPTILTNTRPDMVVRDTEVFGPVAVVETYDSFEDALALANEGRFGLQAGVFTPNVDRLFQAFSELQVGGVIANDVPQYRVDNMPYGGEKDSGFGREGVRYAIEEMTSLRLLALNLRH